MKHRIAHATCLFLLLSLIMVVAGCDRSANTPKNPQQPTVTEKEVSLYFSDDQAMYLVPEKRSIQVKKDASAEDIAAGIINALIEGPKATDLSPTFPPETKLRGVKIESDLATVDFSQELTSKHWGGSTGEAMTLGSLVNSLTDLDGIKRVQILLEGEKVDSLLGHFDTSEPLERNEELLQK